MERNEGFRYPEVTFTQRNVRIDVLEKALEAFTEVYQAFRKAGAGMCLQWKYRFVPPKGGPPST
jgi:hypothetical protein